MPPAGDNLITLAKFHSLAEAAIARGRLEEEGIETRLGEEAVNSWFGHLGGTIAGVKLIVHEYDAPLARHLLGILPEHLDRSADDSSEEDDEDEDWVGEDWADTDEDYDEPYSEEDDDPFSPKQLLTRAWRVSVIGLLLFPMLLACYSLWLLFRHKLWEPLANQPGPNWRFYGSLALNLLALLMAGVLWSNVLHEDISHLRDFPQNHFEIEIHLPNGRL